MSHKHDTWLAAVSKQFELSLAKHVMTQRADGKPTDLLPTGKVSCNGHEDLSLMHMQTDFRPEFRSDLAGNRTAISFSARFESDVGPWI